MNRECSWKISLATFLANIMILLHHANLKSYYAHKVTILSSFIMDFFSAVSIPAMVWFFFVSGYLFYRGLDIKKIPEKWKRRIGSILIPFIIWNTFSVILDFVKGNSLTFSTDFFVENYMFINGVGCANGPLWYLFRLMEYILIAPAIYLIIKNKWFTVCGEIALIVLNYKLGIGYFDITYFLPVYIAGAYYGFNKTDAIEIFLAGNGIRNWKVRLCGMMLGIVLIICLSYSVYILPEPIKSVVRYLSVIGIFLIIRFQPSIKPSRIIINGGVCGFIAVMI